MSPASGASFNCSQTTAFQNPNPNLSSNHADQPQSSCFSFGGKECNGGLNFDFSKMGPDLSGQPRAGRLRYPSKKLRKKVGSENTKFVNSLSSESLDHCSENITGTSTIPTTNISNNVCAGKDGGDETGKFCNVDCTIGAEESSFAFNSSGESTKFVFGASSTSSFVFGAGKSSAELNCNVGYGAKNNSMHSNSKLKNENVAFGAEESSKCFVFGSTNSSSNTKSSFKYVNGVFGVNACDSAMKSSLGDNFESNACVDDNNSSMTSGQKKSSGAMGLSGAEMMQNFDKVSFVFGANRGGLASSNNTEKKGSVNGSSLQSEVDGSGGNMGSVSNGKKISTEAENRIPLKEDCSDCVWKTVPDMRGKVKVDAKDISEKQGHLNFAKDISEKQGHLNFVFSTGTSDGDKEDNSFVFGAKGNISRSTAEMEKSRNSEYAGSAEFFSEGKENAETVKEYQEAYDTNGVFVFGAGVGEKLSSNGSMDAINHLNDEKMKNNSDFITLLNDAMRSNFKFVVGSSSTPGGAFYKIPLSKLFDEMKSLNINDSKGMSSSDQVKDGRSNSCLCNDQLDAVQNNGQMSGTKETGTTLQDQHKDANIGDAVNCNDPNNADTKSPSQGTTEYVYDSETGNLFGGSVKVRQPVGMKNTHSRSNGKVAFEGENSSFAYAGVLGKENQPSESSETTLHVQHNSSSFAAPPTKVEDKETPDFTSTPLGLRSSSKEFNTANLKEPSSATNLFPELNIKFEFFAHSASAKEKKLKKTRRKLRQIIPGKPSAGQGHLSKEGSSPKTFESPGCYSPMDFSPYQHCTDGTPASLATEREDRDSTSGRQTFDIHDNDKKSGEPENVNSKGLNERNLDSNTSSSAQDSLSAIRRQYRKKYKLKIGDGPTGKSASRNAKFSSSSVYVSSRTGNSFNGDKDKFGSGIASHYHDKTDRERTEQDIPEATMVCEHWRMRGNQAYKIGDLSKAEEFYTKGINSVKDNNVSAICSQPLLFCYSNRAATRMSLGRIREALVDCKSATALDPTFSKVKIRAANCHLVLGELQEAIQYYNDFVESGDKVCLDRRFTIESADGLQKAQKVAEGMSRSAEFMQQRTPDAAKSALDILADALSISCYSEKLLEMKGEALLLLQRYNEVIELCEQTLQIAEKNVTSNHLANLDDFECKNSPRLWRWRLMSKSHFHLGRLEVALDLIEKQEQLKLINDRYKNANPEILTPLAVTIRGLLERKKAGNEAFQSGKHVEAIEHYTAAISSSVESRPFAAICFCNRAAAHQAQGQIVDAIADCSLAIALDGNYPKAVSRRATLHEMIRDYKQATNDLQRLTTLLENQLKEQQSSKMDGSSGSNKKELKRARHRLSLMEDMAKKETSLDLYLILGIRESDTESDIKKAYRKAALRHHPDKVGQFLSRNDGRDDGRLWKDIVEKVHEDADRLFKMIGEAYAVLSDTDKRSKYNYEKEMRNFCSNSNRNTSSRRQSDFYSSPYDRGQWSRRQSHFYSSPSGRSGNRRNWQDSWRDDDPPTWW